MKTRLSLIILGFLLSSAAAAVNGRLEGQLTRPDGSALNGVVVTANAANGASGAALTDANGSYLLYLEPGTYTVNVSAGNRSETVPGVEITAGEVTKLNQELDWEMSYADSITVFSASKRRERIVDAPAAVTLVSEQEIERQASHGQVPKLLEFTPGAEVTQSGIYDFNLNTRGFNSSLNRRVAVLIDGRDPSVPFLGAQEWSAFSFPLDDVAQMELVRGPSAALYGANAASGVLNVTTRRPSDSAGGRLRVTAGDLDTTNADARWAAKLNEIWSMKAIGGLRASGDFTVSRNGAAEYTVPCGGTVTTDCLPQEAVPLDPLDDVEITFGSLRVDRAAKNGHLLTIESGLADSSGPVTQTGIGRIQLVDAVSSWTRFNYSTSRWNFLGTHNNREADRQTALNTGQNVALDGSNWRGEIQGNWAFRNDSLRLVAGVSYEDEEITSEDPTGPIRPSLLSRENQQTLLFEPVESRSDAVFAQLDWEINDRVKAVFALRRDDSELHDAQWSPKASFVFNPTQGHTIRLTYNEAFQVPNYSEFFLQASIGPNINLSPLEQICLLDGLFCGFDLDFDGTTNSLATGETRLLALGNANLEVEEVKSLEVGYSVQLAQKGLLQIDVYSTENENFITDLLTQLNPSIGRVNPAFGPYQPPAGMSAPAQAQLLGTLQAALGPLFPLLSNNVDGTPILALASYTNFGAVDTQGVDLGLTWYFSPKLSLNFTYSWFDFDIKESAPGLDQILLPNSPENKASFGLSWVDESWDVGFSARWVDDFRWAVGPFQGDVLSYTLADLTANVYFGERWSFGINVANIFDEEHWESFGGDLLGRRALASVSVDW